MKEIAIDMDTHACIFMCICVRTYRLGYGEAELQGVLGWIQDLAPMCVHIHIGTVGRSLA